MPEVTEEQHVTLKQLRKRYHAETAGEGVMQRAYQNWLEERYLELKSRLTDVHNQLENARAAKSLWGYRCETAMSQLAASQEREQKLAEALKDAARELLSYDQSYGGGGGESSAFEIAQLLGYEGGLSHEAVDEWLAQARTQSTTEETHG